MTRSFKCGEGTGGITNGTLTGGKRINAWEKAGPEQSPRAKATKTSVRRTIPGHQPTGCTLTLTTGSCSRTGLKVAAQAEPGDHVPESARVPKSISAQIEIWLNANAWYPLPFHQS